MAKEDNWILYGLGALIIGMFAFFGLGKTVQIQAGQATGGSSCGCGH